MSGSSRLVLWCAGACLTVGLGVSLLAWKDETRPTRTKLAEVLPKQIADWAGQDLPLGDVEVKNATTRLLNYDDYIYRVYRRGTEEVFLYTMYWKQGSISVREIAGHVPEDCWPANGAQLLGSRDTHRFTIVNQLTAQAELRGFLFPGGQRVQVAWWHLWGNNIVDRSFDQKSLMPTLNELWVWLVKRQGVRRDQLLVRIHSSGDLDEAMQSEPVQAFLAMFPEVFTAMPLTNP